MISSLQNAIALLARHVYCNHTRTQSLILHKMLTFTGTLNISRFRENWDVVVTNEFIGFNLKDLTKPKIEIIFAALHFHIYELKNYVSDF